VVGQLERYNVLKVICGSDQTFCLAHSLNESPKSGETPICFSWGSNQNAKLGHSYFKTTPNEIQQSSSIQIVKQPTCLKSLDGYHIDGLSCGTNHSFAWNSENGQVYGWGLGLNGRLGNESESIVSDPQSLECFREAASFGMKVIQVSCGENHTLALVEIGYQFRINYL
jgi:alpha-tubulin suppressor-like RCC1 family protein